MKMRTMRFVLLIAILVLGSSAVGYAGGNSTVDYTQGKHWLALPAAPDKAVDVFFLYPTAWQKVDKSEPNVCAIDNPSMQKGSREAFARTATAFEPVANIFAPYYRQADAIYTLTLPSEAARNEFLQTAPGPDIFAAFDYYIQHFNQGRPFILAGHSQGSQLLTLLLSDYMKEHPQVYDRMIAAYVVGYSITGEYLAQNPHLKFAEGPDDTGVIISYNTEAPVVTVHNPVVLPGAMAINPITWSRNDTVAPAAANLGSFLPDRQGNLGLTKQFADARIDQAKGVLVCSADVARYAPGNPLVKGGVYHNFDYPLYYYNIRANAANRVEKFFQKP